MRQASNSGRNGMGMRLALWRPGELEKQILQVLGMLAVRGVAWVGASCLYVGLEARMLDTACI